MTKHACGQSMDTVKFIRAQAKVLPQFLIIELDDEQQQLSRLEICELIQTFKLAYDPPELFDFECPPKVCSKCLTIMKLLKKASSKCGLCKRSGI